MRWSRFFRREQWDEERARELEAYLEIETEENVARGISPEEARYAAQRKLGNVTLIREEIYRINSFRFLDTLSYDVRFACRMLRKNPGFTAVVLLTVAIGIGANTAMFSVVNAVLLRPLPFPHSDGLMFLAESNREIPEMYISMPNLRDWQSMNTVFESIAGARPHGATLTGRGEPERMAIREVTADLFPTLGMKPIIGRALTPDDDQVQSRPVVVLSESFWTREFQRDPRVLSLQLELNDQPYTVIGVMPDRGSRVFWSTATDAYTSLGRLENTIGGPEHRGDHYGIYGYARLKPGVTVEVARADMRRVAAEMAKRYPNTNRGQSAVVQPLLGEAVEDVQRPLLLLMAAVGLVLLIACANVANLLTSLATVRRREIAVRSALGAGRARLARQFLCESILLSLIGGTIGLIAAYCIAAAASQTLAHLPARFVPRFDEINVDPTVLLFTLGLSVLTGVVFGVFPAIAAYRADPNEVLKENSRTTGTGLSDMRLRNGLVATELALSLVLLVAAGLTIKSLFHVLQADSGFQSDGVLTASLVLPTPKYQPGTQTHALVGQLTAQLAALPGVQAAGMKSPLLGPYEDNFVVEGRPRPPQGFEPYTEISTVTPGALEAMSVRLLDGRYFKTGDDEHAQRVCIVDDTFAERYWPGESAIGKRISTMETPTTPPQWATIVGIVHHVENDASGGPTLPGSYFPFAQEPATGGSLVIRSTQDPLTLMAAVRRVLHSLDPDLALSDVRPLSNLTRERVAPRKLSSILLSVLAGIALVLATVGTYGVMAYMVAGRTQEIGVRRALGARPVDVLLLVMKQGILVTLGGLVAGVAGSLVTGRIVSPMLLGVKASDPVILASVGGLLMAVAAAACYIPAHKAMALDPIAAVRHE